MTLILSTIIITTIVVAFLASQLEFTGEDYDDDDEYGDGT